MSVSTGTRLGRYEIRSKLGEGGMGEVYLALDTRLDRAVAGIRWTSDGRALTYVVNRGGVSNIWIQTLDGSPPRQLTEFKTDRIFSFDWSADGKWLALSRGPEQRDVVLMSDFK